MGNTKTNGREVFDGSITHVDIDLSGTTVKTSPVAADYFIVVDSAAPTVLKKVSFTEASKFFIPYTGGVANFNLGVHNLTVDTNTLFVDATNHKLGIGTISPAEILHVYSSADAAMLFETATGRFAQIQLKSGATNKWIIGTQNNYLSNALVLRNGVQDVAVITTAGAWGIGSVSPTAWIHITKAGTIVPGTAPLKFTVGTLNATPEVGALETAGAYMYYTASLGGRRRIAYIDEVPTGVISGGGAISTIPYWDTTSSLTSSSIYFDSSRRTVGVNVQSPTARFHVGRFVDGLGSVSAGVNGYDITGTDTYFLTEFKIGDSIYIRDSGETYVVASITSDTDMAVTSMIITDVKDGRYEYVNNFDLFSVFGNGMVGFGTATPQGNFDVVGTYGSQFLLTKNQSILGLGNANGDWEGIKIDFDGGSPTVSIGSGGFTGNGCMLVVDDNTDYIYVNRNFGVGTATPSETLTVAGNILAQRITGGYEATLVRTESKMGTGYSAVPASYEFKALGIGTNDAILSGDVLGRIRAVGMTSTASWQDGPYIDFRAKANWTGSTYAGHNSDIAFFAPSSHGLAAMSVNYRGVEVNPDSNDVNFIVNGDTYSNVLCVKASVDRVGLMTNNPTSLLHVMGSIATRVVTLSVTGGYTLGTLDSTLVVTYNGASSTITLPTAEDCTGRIYAVKNFTGSIGGQDVIISRSGTDQIMTSSLENSITITNGKTALFQSAGSGKWIHLGTIQK